MGEVPKVLPSEKARVAEVQRLMAEKAEKKRQKDAEQKAYWDEYHAQLEKSTPNQGGAKKYNKKKARRVFPFYRF